MIRSSPVGSELLLGRMLWYRRLRGMRLATATIKFPLPHRVGHRQRRATSVKQSNLHLLRIARRLDRGMGTLYHHPQRHTLNRSTGGSGKKQRRRFRPMRLCLQSRKKNNPLRRLDFTNWSVCHQKGHPIHVVKSKWRCVRWRCNCERTQLSLLIRQTWKILPLWP